MKSSSKGFVIGVAVGFIACHVYMNGMDRTPRPRP